MTFKIGPGIQLKDAVKASLWTYEPVVLYWATIQQYKAKQSKKRCIAIYDTFIKSSGPWEGAIAESSDVMVNQVASRRQMDGMVDWMRELRETAAGMNFLTRMRTSSARQVTHADFFDSYNEMIKLEMGNGPLTNFLTSPQARKPLPGWKIPADKAKAALEAAGFDTKALGLKEI